MSEADQEKARAMYDSWFADGDRDDEIVGEIAGALAEEREKARAPFLALADEALQIAEEQEAAYPSSHRVRAVADTRRIYAYSLRRAAEVTE